MPPEGSEVRVGEIDQGYLPGHLITERIRRIADNDGVQYLRTIKAGAGVVRTEIEESIDAKLFEQLWPLTEGRRVRKVRTTVTDDAGRKWEIDEFLDRELFLAEIELAAPDADAEPPAWLARCVVRDCRRANGKRR